VEDLSARWHLEFGMNVRCDFGRVIINEVPNAVVWDAPEFCPTSQRANGGFFVFGKNPAEAETDDVSELVLCEGCILWRFHAHACQSSAAGGTWLPLSGDGQGRFC